MSAKNKIFALLALWIVLSALMFMYFFGFLDASNKQSLDNMAVLETNLAVLTAEKQSNSQAQADLQKLAQEQYQPDNFFTKDITFVNEIQALENLSQSLGVQMQLSGISGTVGTAAKAKTITPIVAIPYNITVVGSLQQVTDFVETLQNLSFITDVSGFSLNAADKGTVNMSLTGNFYLQQ
jgi:Tfp pilus assembly protein PilO